MGGKSNAATPTPTPPMDYAAMMASMMPMHMPEVSGASAEDLAEQTEANRVAQGESDRDSAYADYMDAAGSSTDYVNAEIAKERANAKLLNIDYDMTNDVKAQRVNDYFATVWGEGQQSKLDQLMGEFGNPEGFTEYAVTRGDASTYGNEETGTENPVGGTVGTTKRGISSPLDEDEELGGTVTPLG